MSSRLLFLILAISLCAHPAMAQNLTALARVQPEASSLQDKGANVELRLALSRPVPFRVFSLDNPRRLVLDFNEVDWTGLKPGQLDRSGAVTKLRVGMFRPGWSRMVIDLDRPLGVETATIDTRNAQWALVFLRLVPVSAAEFAAISGAPDGALYAPLAINNSAIISHRRQVGERPLVVVLDPGHGGIDPGAEFDGAVEADLMLMFARELQEALLRAGNFKVVLTREGNEFVPLEARVSLARNAGADVFLSLHADALIDGRASGATIYTLSDRASDTASKKLAERHDRADLLAGVDLSGQDDVIATILMELARTETAPRADKLADALVAGLSEAVGVHKHPRMSAGFSVLKAPDIPSVLIELGYLSSPHDLKRLRDPEWRQRAANGVRAALQAWAVEDAADALLLRK
ncbi:MAG: N-acetylmuramoyl-L-alanine amidase [Paracoccaceae bacterium]